MRNSVKGACEAIPKIEMLLFLGLLSWLAVGLIPGTSARRMLPSEPPMGRMATGVGLGGALASGLLPITLGLGGMAADDVRSLVTATLSAVIGLMLALYLTLKR